MIRYYLLRKSGDLAALVYVRETLQFREKIRVLKPLGTSRLSPGVIRLGSEIVGSVTLRLNRSILPDLLSLITGSLTSSAPVPQTEGLFFHDLETRDGEEPVLSLLRSFDESVSLLEDLSLGGFCLRGRRTEPVLLKLDLEGINLKDGSFGKEGAPSLPDEAFLYLTGDEVTVDGNTLPDLAAFSLTGSFTGGSISHELMIRRKDCIDTDYSLMRNSISVFLTLHSREFFEKGQRVRCEISIDQAVYRGEESFPDNKGIWGREFRYTVIGPLKIRVFTHLDDRGASL